MAYWLSRNRRIGSIAATACLITLYSNAGVLAKGPVPSLAELPAAIRAVGDDFRPLGTADVEAARDELDAAVARLHKRLEADGEQGDQWQKHLSWGDLQRALASKEPDLEILGEVQKRLAADREGLEMAWFLDVRDALARYRNTVRNVDNPQLPAAYGQVIEALAKQVEQYTANPDAKGALAIGYLLDQLRSAGQAEEIIRAVRHHLVQPNLRFRVSAEFLAVGLEGPVDHTGPVRDCILGTDVRADARTLGHTAVELIPDDRFAVIDAVLLATTEADSVGYNGPVRIFSNATTELTARKRIWFDAGGVHSYRAVSRAKTNNRVRSVCAVRGGLLLAGLARRRVAQQEPLAEAIAADHAEARLRRRIDEEAEEPLLQLDRLYQEKVRRPLPERRLFPERLSFRTTKEAIWVDAVQADAAQLAALDEPPKIDPQGLLQVAVHESLVHNVADRALAGRTLTQEQYKALRRWLRDESSDDPPEMDGEPWAVSFPDRRPVSVEFAKDAVTITIRVQSYHEGDQSYPGMDATVRYQVQPKATGSILVRQGKIAIFPPGFKPGGRTRLTPRQVIARKLLEKRYQRLFPPELLTEGFVPQGEWAKIGRLRAAIVKAGGGWLAAAWQAQPEEGAVPDEAEKASTDGASL